MNEVQQKDKLSVCLQLKTRTEQSDDLNGRFQSKKNDVKSNLPNSCWITWFKIRGATGKFKSYNLIHCLYKLCKKLFAKCHWNLLLIAQTERKKATETAQSTISSRRSVFPLRYAIALRKVPQLICWQNRYWIFKWNFCQIFILLSVRIDK